MRTQLTQLSVNFIIFLNITIDIFSIQNGDTALHIAAAMGRRKLTRVLLEAGEGKTVS